MIIIILKLGENVFTEEDMKLFENGGVSFTETEIGKKIKIVRNFLDTESLLEESLIIP